MTDIKGNEMKFDFSSPACYKIKVWGKLPYDLTDKLYGMEISHHKREGQTYSLLEGSLPDQPALSGILNMLYDMHYTVLSVNKVKDKPSNTKH